MTRVIASLAIGPSIPLELINGEPPTEIRLFRAGVNPSSKGDWIFDDKAAAEVMKTYREMGRDWVSIDYDHGSLQKNPIDPGRSSRSAGIAKLELRRPAPDAASPYRGQDPGGSELWATSIRWSKPARQSIIDGEWPSVSPGFAYDEDRRITWVINFALTGNPALHHPYELVAANTVAERVARLSAVPFTAHGLVDGSWDADGAVARLRRWASKDGSGDREQMEWERYAAGFAWADPARLEDFGGYKLPHHDVIDGNLVDSRAGIQEAASVLRGTEAASWMPAADVPAVRRHLAQHYMQWGARAPWEPEGKGTTMMGLKDLMMKKSIAEIAAFFGVTEEEVKSAMAAYDEELAAGKKPDEAMMGVKLSIGLSATAPAGDLMSRVGALRSFESEVEAALGVKGRAAALGSITGLIEAKKQADKDSAELARLQAESAKTRVEALLSAARTEHKITKAEFDDASEHGLRAKGMKEPEWLQHHLEKRSKIAALAINFQEPERKSINGGQTGASVGERKYEQLSNVEKAQLEKTDPETFAALRADWKHRGEPQAPKAA